jgi:hypothetical protein
MDISSTGLRLDQPARYRIQVQGRLDAAWARWFQVSRIQVTRAEHQAPVTTLEGAVIDQSELYGWLARLRDLGLPLLLVEFLGIDEQGDKG